VRPGAEAVKHGGGLAGAADALRARPRQALSRPDIEGYALPAPGIDLKSQGRERLHRRVRRHALLRPVTAKLSAYEVVRGDGCDRLEDFHLLVSNGFAVRPDGRLHGQVAQDLEKMILDDVAHGAGSVVEGASALNTEIFRHGDLHALDMIPVPEGLQEGIGKTEEEHVVHRPLPEVV